MLLTEEPGCVVNGLFALISFMTSHCNSIINGITFCRYLEAEGMEKTYNFTQDQLISAVDEEVSKKVCGCNFVLA